MRLFSFRKNVIFLVIVLFFISLQIKTRYFIQLSPGDRIIDIAADSCNVLNAVRYTFGEVITTSTYLTSSGTYKLGDNIDGTITIGADDIYLDLNNRIIYDSIGTKTLIEVENGKKNISIVNGSINGKEASNSPIGILIKNGTSLITLKNIKMRNFDIGIYFEGELDLEIKACGIKKCVLDNCNKAFVADFIKGCLFQNCEATNCEEAGFELHYSKFNEIKKCSSREISNDDPTIEVVGFATKSGQGNLFHKCVAEGIYKEDSDFCVNAIGFLLSGTTESMEEETKIINCIVDSTKTATIGSSPAYGIFLEPKILDALSTITSTDLGAPVNTVAWSLDGKYLATGNINDEVSIFNFDGFILDIIDTVTTIGSFVTSVVWSPNGKYLAAGSINNKISVFSFDGSALTKITDSGTDITNSVNSVAWSPNGKYLAAGSNDNKIYIFSFDGFTLTKITDSGTDITNNVNSVAWSPDGKYVAAGSNDNKAYVFSFKGSILTKITDSDTDITNNVNSVAWSPDGKYLAAGSNDSKVYVFSFDKSGLTKITDYSLGIGNTILYVEWSPDGKYLAFTNLSPFGNMGIYVLSFNGSSLVPITNYVFPGDIEASGISWEPSGKYLATAVQDNLVYVFSIMNAPQKCIIDGNRIANTTGAFNGIGISGGGNNLFIRNIGYNNDINFSYGVMRTAGLTGSIGLLDNIWVPPYIFYVTN